MDLELQGKRALITGANRGTGEVIALHLAREGVQVFVQGNEPTDPRQERVAQELRDAGFEAQAVSGDLRADAGADAVHAAVMDHTAGAGVDILVNNYGGPGEGNWHVATSEAWVAAYQHNVLSAVRMIDRFVPNMRARSCGRVIQLATSGALRPNRRMPHYYAAKTALVNLSVSLALELAGTGITVNTVSPGLIHTQEVEASFRALAKRRDWGEDWMEIERKALETLAPNPCRRLAQPAEVADLVVFLASRRAAYINGCQLRIDGGATGLAL